MVDRACGLSTLCRWRFLVALRRFTVPCRGGRPESTRPPAAVNDGAATPSRRGCQHDHLRLDGIREAPALVSLLGRLGWKDGIKIHGIQDVGPDHP